MKILAATVMMVSVTLTETANAGEQVTREMAIAALSIYQLCSTSFPESGYTMERMYARIAKDNPGSDTSLIKQLAKDPNAQAEARAASMGPLPKSFCEKMF